MLKVELSAIEEAGVDPALVGISLAEIEKSESTGSAEGTSDDTGVSIENIREVIAECENEAEQKRAYKLLTEAGIKCRLSTL